MSPETFGSSPSIFSVRRILGPAWYYLMLWMWGIAALMLLSIVWAAAGTVARLDSGRTMQLRGVASATLLLMTMLFTGRHAVTANSAVQSGVAGTRFAPVDLIK